MGRVGAGSRLQPHPRRERGQEEQPKPPREQLALLAKLSPAGRASGQSLGRQSVRRRRLRRPQGKVGIACGMQVAIVPFRRRCSRVVCARVARKLLIGFPFVAPVELIEAAWSFLPAC